MKKIGFILGYMFLANQVLADVHDPQGTFLTRDLPSANAAESTLTNYLNAVVREPYGLAPSDLTFDTWKSRNLFNSEPVLSAEYYNSADLGLGRDMNCVAQESLESVRGEGAMACFVSNHGKIGAGAEAAFIGLNTNNNEGESEFSEPFATVAMEYWPNHPKNKVRFFVFAEQSGVYKLFTGLNVALDNGSGHPQPGLCLACHGGEVKEGGASITDAHFLPFDTFSFEFETPEKREEARPIFDDMNRLVHRAESTAYPSSSTNVNQQIWKYLAGSYPGGIDSPTSTLSDSYTPPEFNENDENKELYHAVAKPFCRGCHLASPATFVDADVVLTPELLEYGCLSDEMPHAEVNDANFLRHMEFIAPLMKKHLGTDACFNLPTLVDFQTDLSANPAVRFGLEAQGLTGNFIPHLNSRLTETPETAPERFAPPLLNDGVNNQRRTLQQSINGKVVTVSPLRGGRTIEKVELIGRNASNTIEPQEPTINAHALDANGFKIPGSDIVLKNKDVPNLVPGFFTQHFTANNSLIESFVFRMGCGSLLAKTKFCRTEIDDLLVYSAPPTKNVTLIDFEEYPVKNFSSLDEGINTTLTTEGCADRSAISFHTGGTNAFHVGNQLKVRGDSGRYSLQSPAIACRGDFTQLALSSLWENTIPDDTLVEVELDFSYHTDAVRPGLLHRINVTTPSLSDLAKRNGSYIEKNGISSGSIKIKAKANDDSRITVHFTKEIGFNGAPVQGLAIDNISVVILD